MMPEAAELPWIAAVPVALLLLAGAGLTLAGSIGLLRLRDFYQRVHAPTIGTSYGMGCILAASMIFSITRYDSDAAAGPICTASSAMATCTASRSASE